MEEDEGQAMVAAAGLVLLGSHQMVRLIISKISAGQSSCVYTYLPGPPDPLQHLAFAAEPPPSPLAAEVGAFLPVA